MALSPFSLMLPAATLLSSVFSGSIFIRPRNIAGFVADVTLEERHADMMTITEHPVENGANISDHCFKQPARLTLTAGFSNSGPNAGFSLSYIDETYQNFLSLQASREPFTIQTGKRAYTNMLMASLVEVTDANHENAMMLVMECHEILIANTQTVSVPPSNVQANPQVTGAPTQTGTAALQPAPNFNATAAP